MRLQQRIGSRPIWQKRVVQVLNLRVPGSWGPAISRRASWSVLEVIQRTMAIAGPVVLEDYSRDDPWPGGGAGDAARLFAESQTGRPVDEAEVDGWIRTAVQSVDRGASCLATSLAFLTTREGCGQH